jgi:arsenate reductase-like glutaredoxin family protein
VEINDRDFFKEKFSRDEIKELLQGKPAAEMFNFKSPGFKKLGVDKDSLSDEKLIDLMLEEPRLVRRPVVRIDGEVYFSAGVPVLEKLIK